MKILIIGSGLIGLSSAFFLSKSGHKITLIDKEKSFGNGASFSNGGQISASYSQPWSSIDNLLKMVTWIGKNDSPILYKPKLDSHQINWSLDFLKQCLPKNNEKNIKEMLKLSLYSRDTMSLIDDEYNFDYFKQSNGIITFYQNKKSFDSAKKFADIMRHYGLEREILTKDETLKIEPILNNKNFNLFGSDYTKNDFSGDAYEWMKNILNICKNEYKMETLFSTEVVDFIQEKNGKITNVVVKNTDNNESFFLNGFDKIVLCAGSYSYLISKMLGQKYNIYPVKGYSTTMIPKDKNLINKVSLTDSENKIVFTNINDKLRVAGTAEFNGFDLTDNFQRNDFLKNKAIEYFGDIFENVSYWNGLRPTTTTGIPYIGMTNIKDFYINSGHGTLGWTMAAASGRIISQIINEKEKFGDFLW